MTPQPTAAPDAAVEITRLPGGLTVVTERMPHVRSVTAGAWVGIGSRDEAPAEAGASHFLEHLLFKGTAERSARAIAEAVDASGGEMNAFTGKELTAYYVRTLDRAAPPVLDILVDILSEPALRPDEVEAERHVILEELAAVEDEPADLVHDLFAEAALGDHPLGRSVLGDEDALRSMSRDDIASFFERQYTPDRIVVAAAGRVEHDDVVAAVRDRLDAGAPAGPPPRSAPRPDAAAGPGDPKVVLLERDAEQANVVIGCATTIGRDHPDRFPLEALSQAVGGGMSSRLFQQVREERGLAYSVYSFRSGYQDDIGLFGVYAGTSPDHVAEVVALVRSGLAEVARDGITERELELAKAQMVGGLLLGLEDSGSRWDRIGRAVLVHGRVAGIDEVCERIDAITVDDVRRVAAVALAGAEVVAAVGPCTEADLC